MKRDTFYRLELDPYLGLSWALAGTGIQRIGSGYFISFFLALEAVSRLWGMVTINGRSEGKVEVREGE
jgi:hypothetical protein